MNLANNKFVIGAVSSALISGAAIWEGTKYYAYKDIVGVPTVCQGYTGSGIIFGKKYSPEECANYTTQELKKHGIGVLQCINVPISQNQYNAYTLFAYNVGVGAFCGSRALKELNKGNYEASCHALARGPDGSPAWSFAGGKFVQGLANRRAYEEAMCLGTNEEANAKESNNPVVLSRSNGGGVQPTPIRR